MVKTMRAMTALLLAALLLAGGCLAEAENTDALALVNGKEVPIGDAQAEFEYYAGLYEMYGMGDQIDELRGDIAEFYVKQFLLMDACEAMGLGEFSDEELAGFAAEAQAQYDEMTASYIEYFQDENVSDEEALAQVKAFFDENDYTVEGLTESIRRGAMLDRFGDQIDAGSVSEEDVRARYDDLVAGQRDTYDEDAYTFEADVMYDSPIYYVPEGFRSVYHILLLLDDEATATLYELQARQEEIAAALTAEGADTAALKAEEEAIGARIDELVAPLMERVEEIRARLDAGEDFLALMEEYGEDPGMQSEPFMSKGYYVSAGSEMWDKTFRDAAMALEKEGDVSEPVLTGYGLHLILHAGELPSGPVPFEAVRAEIEAELTDELREDAYQAAVDRLYEAAEITLYPENLRMAEDAGEDEAAG